MQGSALDAEPNRQGLPTGGSTASGVNTGASSSSGAVRPSSSTLHLTVAAKKAPKVVRPYVLDDPDEQLAQLSAQYVLAECGESLPAAMERLEIHSSTGEETASDGTELSEDAVQELDSVNIDGYKPEDPEAGFDFPRDEDELLVWALGCGLETKADFIFAFGSAEEAKSEAGPVAEIVWERLRDGINAENKAKGWATFQSLKRPKFQDADLREALVNLRKAKKQKVAKMRVGKDALQPGDTEHPKRVEQAEALLRYIEALGPFNRINP